jgi:hypothetical protein
MGAGAALVGAGTVAATAGAGAAAAGGITAAGALAAGAGVVSAGASLLGASKTAAGQQAAAGVSAAQNRQTRADLLPYNTAGQSALTQIGNNLPAYSSTDNSLLTQAGGFFAGAANLGSGPNEQAALEATPGYQFTKQQGLQAVQNGAAARGLGVSGAALKGAAAYATGLADTTYGDQFNKLVASGNNSLTLNNANQANLNSSYNRLLGISQLGEGAAAQTGITGATLANQTGQALIGAGNADAAGVVGVGTAATGAANNFATNQLLQGQLAVNAQNAQTNANRFG